MTTQTPAPSGQSAKERAAQVGDTAREQSAQVAGTAKEQALDVAQDAANQARDLMAELRQQLRQQTDVQRQRLTELLDEFSDELETMADAGGRSGTATEVVRQAAQRLRSLSGYVEGGSDVGTDLRRFASRRPGTFILGAVVVGVLAGRATRGAAAVRNEQNESGAGGRVIDVRNGSTSSHGSTSSTETPIAQQVAADLGAADLDAADLQESGRVATEYAVPTEPRTIADDGGDGFEDGVEVGSDDDLSRTRDPNLEWER